MTAGVHDLRPTGGTCPICQSRALHAFRPFCSKRCADIDLGRWLTEAYVIPVDPDGDEDGDAANALAGAAAIGATPETNGDNDDDDEDTGRRGCS